jgi:uncharacterized protein (TIGR01777 family)
MEVFITGGSGFVGRALCKALLRRGRSVTVLTRSPDAARALPRGAGHCLGDPSRPGPWQAEAAQHRFVVNLAGASIFGRWTRPYKELILSSRADVTRNLAEALSGFSGEPPVLVSASAVGYYGFHGDEELDESSPPGDDFLARVCRRWEDEARRAEAFGARVVLARLGVGRGRGGGALAKMAPVFRLGLGGRLGRGRQWFSWIHLHDAVAALIFCLENPRMSGAVNFTAPQPTTNREFTRALGRALRRPALLPVPAWVLRLAMGEMSSLLLRGQRALPKALGAAGFQFRHDVLEKALADLR